MADKQFGADELRALFVQAVKRGYCSWETFESLDKSGKGYIGPKEFRLGLEEAGVELEPAVVSRLFANISQGRPDFTFEHFEQFVADGGSESFKQQLEVNKANDDNSRPDTAATLNSLGREREETGSVVDVMKHVLESKLTAQKSSPLKRRQTKKEMTTSTSITLDDGTLVKYKLITSSNQNQTSSATQRNLSVLFLPDALDTHAAVDKLLAPLITKLETTHPDLHVRMLTLQLPVKSSESPQIAPRVLECAIKLYQGGIWGNGSKLARGSESKNPTFEPWVLIGSGLGAHIGLELATATANLPEVNTSFFQQLSALVVINAFTHTDERIVRVSKEILRWTDEPELMDESIAQKFFSKDHIASGTSVGVVGMFKLDRPGLGRPANTQEDAILMMNLVESVERCTDLKDSIHKLKAPVIIIHSTENAIVDPLHVQTIVQALGKQAVCRNIRGSLVRSKSSNLEKEERDSTCRLCVQWLKSGHQVIQERATFIRKILFDVVSIAHPDTIKDLVDQKQTHYKALQEKKAGVEDTKSSVQDIEEEGDSDNSMDDKDDAIADTPKGVLILSPEDETNKKENKRSPYVLPNNEQNVVTNELTIASPSQSSSSDAGSFVDSGDSRSVISNFSNRTKGNSRRTKKRRSSAQIVGAKSTYAMLQEEQAERTAMGHEDALSREQRMIEIKQGNWTQQFNFASERIKRLRKARLDEQARAIHIQPKRRKLIRSNTMRTCLDDSDEETVYPDDTFSIDGEGRPLAMAGRGVARLRMDMLRIQAKKTTLVFRAQRIQKRLQAAIKKRDDCEDDIQQCKRAMSRLERTALSPVQRRALKKAKSGKEKLAVRGTFELTSLPLEVQREHGHFNNRMTDAQALLVRTNRHIDMTEKELGAVNPKIQQITVNHETKVVELHEAHQRLREQAKTNQQELNQARRERADFLFRQGEQKVKERKNNGRHKLLVTERNRIRKWPAKYVDSDVWQSGVKQRIRLVEFKEHLSVEIRAIEDALKAMKDTRKDLREKQATVDRYIVALHTEQANLRQQIGITKELRSQVEKSKTGAYSNISKKNKNENDDDMDDSKSIMAGQYDFLDDCFRIRETHPDERSEEEQLWALYDQGLNPDLYGETFEKAKEQGLSWPQKDLAEKYQYHQLPIPALQRIAALPEGVNQAMPFLRNHVEIEAHCLIQKFSFSRGETHMQQEDEEQHKRLKERYWLQRCGWDASLAENELRKPVSVFLTLKEALKEGLDGGIRDGARVYVQTPEQPRILWEQNQHLNGGAGQLFEFTVTEKDCDLFSQLTATVVFKGSFQARGYVLGRLSIALFYVEPAITHSKNGTTSGTQLDLEDEYEEKVDEGELVRAYAGGGNGVQGCDDYTGPHGDVQHLPVLQPLGWASYAKASACTPDSMGSLSIFHTPNKDHVPVLPGKYQLVIGAASKVSFSLSVHGNVIRRVEDDIKHELELVKKAVERNGSAGAEMSELVLSLRLADRKLHLVVAMEKVAKEQCEELEENMRTVSYRITEGVPVTELDAGTDSNNDDYDPTVLADVLIGLERRFSRWVQKLATRRQEAKDIQNGIDRMNEIKRALRRTVQANQALIKRNKQTIPKLLRLLHGTDSHVARKAAEQLEESATDLTNSVIPSEANNTSQEVERLINLTPAQRIRQQYFQEIPLNEDEARWVELDQILHVELYQGRSKLGQTDIDEEEQEEEDEEDGDDKNENKLTRNKRKQSTFSTESSDLGDAAIVASRDFSREDLERCINAKIHDLTKEELGARKLLLRFHDREKNPEKLQDEGMLILDRLKSGQVKSVDLGLEERWWAVHNKLLHPEHYEKHMLPEDSMTIDSMDTGDGRSGSTASTGLLSREELLAFLVASNVVSGVKENNEEEEDSFEMEGVGGKLSNTNKKLPIKVSAFALALKRQKSSFHRGLTGLTGLDDNSTERINVPKIAQQTLRMFASTLEMRCVTGGNEALSGKKKGRGMADTEFQMTHDIDARCRQVLLELDHVSGFKKAYVDSNVLHGSQQRFPTAVLQAELARELDNLLKSQVNEREAYVVAREERKIPVATMMVNGEDGSDYDSDEMNPIGDGEMHINNKNINSTSQTSSTGLDNKGSTATDGTDQSGVEGEAPSSARTGLKCMACRGPCQWKPSVMVDEVVDRMRAISLELEIIRQLDPSIVFIDTELPQSVVRGGKSRMVRKDAVEELMQEMAQLKRHKRLIKVDKELHFAHSTKSEFVETEALHGYKQMQWTANVIVSLEGERDRIIAQDMAGSVVDDVLNWMLDGWMFGDLPDFVPAMPTKAEVEARDMEEVKNGKRRLEDVGKDALTIAANKQLDRQKSDYHHQLDETEHTLQFGMFTMALMYFRSMTLLKRSMDSTAGSVSLGMPAETKNATAERQRMVRQAELGEWRERRIKQAMGRAEVGIRRREARIEKERKEAKDKLRTRLIKIRNENRASAKIQALVRGHVGRLAVVKYALKVRELNDQKKLEFAAVVAIQSVFRGYRARVLVYDKIHEMAAFIARLREQEAEEDERDYWNNRPIRKWFKGVREGFTKKKNDAAQAIHATATAGLDKGGGALAKIKRTTKVKGEEGNENDDEDVDVVVVPEDGVGLSNMGTDGVGVFNGGPSIGLNDGVLLSSQTSGRVRRASMAPDFPSVRE